jgi:hypothetical protein
MLEVVQRVSVNVWHDAYWYVVMNIQLTVHAVRVCSATSFNLQQVKGIAAMRKQGPNSAILGPTSSIHNCRIFHAMLAQEI